MLVTAAYLAPIVWVLYSVGDDGTSIYGAQLVSQGAIPGRDFVEVIGPGAFYWLGLLFKVFGTGWWVSRIDLLLTGVASVGFLYAIAREVCQQWAADLSWLFMLVMSMPLWPVMSHHWDSNLLSFAAVWCYLQFEKNERPSWAMLSGGLIGLTTCFVQQKGVLLLAAIGVSTLLRRTWWRGETRMPLMRALLFVCGADAAIGLAVLGAFSRAGALRDLLYANLIFPLSGYHDLNKTGYGYGLVSYATGPARDILTAATQTLLRHLGIVLSLFPFWLMALLPLIAALFAGAWFMRKGHKAWSPCFAILAAGAGLWLSEIHRRDVVHLAFGAPLLLIGWFAIAQPLARFTVVKFAAVLLTVSLLVFGTLNFVDRTRGLHAVETRHGTLMSAADFDALRFLGSAVNAGDYVFIYPYSPMLYYLADVRNPTRYSILLYHYNTQAQFEEVIHDLDAKRVQYILDSGNDDPVVRGGFPFYRRPPADQLILEQYMDRQYTQTGMAGRFRILKRRNQTMVRQCQPK